MGNNRNKRKDLKSIEKKELPDGSTIGEVLEQEKLQPSQVAKGMRLSPQKRRMYGMPKDVLLKHNALIFHKGSSLSYNERRMVQERVAYGINKGTIKPEEVAVEINKLNALIQGEIIKQTENADILTDK